MSDEKAVESRGRGRPPIEIDLVQLETLAKCGATNAEVAAFFKCSERTIEARRAEDPEFLEIMERGVHSGDLSLRRKQMTQALNGDRTMLIWLGKQRLGQRDKISNEHSGPGGRPIQHSLLDLTRLTEDELATLERLLSKTAPSAARLGAGEGEGAPREETP